MSLEREHQCDLEVELYHENSPDHADGIPEFEPVYSSSAQLDASTNSASRFETLSYPVVVGALQVSTCGMHLWGTAFVGIKAFLNIAQCLERRSSERDGTQTAKVEQIMIIDGYKTFSLHCQ